MKRTALLAALLISVATTVMAQEWMDVTEDFVVNPNFDGNIEGWVDAFDGSAQNHGYMGANYSNGDVSISLFAEAWRDNNDWMSGGVLGNGSITQALTTVPAGQYRLEADAIAVDQGYRNNPVTGVLLFISDGTNEATTEIATDNGAPQHFTTEFTTTKTAITIGVRTENPTANWLAFDNVRLYWYGTERKMTRISMSKTSATIRQGDQLQLKASPFPSTSTFKGITWTSSNENAASVDENGLVTAKKPGITTITATSKKYPEISGKCIITITTNVVQPNAVIINEVQQANVDMFIDPSFNYGGWIELYNSTDDPVVVDGLYVQDNQGNRWPLTSSRQGMLSAKSFLTLWFDHFSWWTPKTVNFKLDCDGGYIAITNEQGTVLSELNYPPALARTSYARKTDGGNEWGYTDQPTPGETNASSAFAQVRLEAPVIDKEGGLFSTNFTANVTNIPSGATVRYTTDGSTPTLTNGQTSTNGRFPVSGTAILRVRFFQDGKLASPVTTRSYIKSTRSYTLPVLSLVSDPKNLTGADYGIFVQGNGNGRPGNGQSANCNWNMDWDRPANIEFFDETGTSVFNQEVSIEPSGGWSRAWSPHSFNIKANKVYEGVNRMDYQFFKNKPFLRHKGLKVRNGGNDTSQRIKDGAIQEVVRTAELYVETQSFQPVHLYQNGRYIGVLNLREPNNKNYGYANYGIGTDDDEMDQWKMSPDSGYVQQVGTKDVFDEWYSLAQNAGDALVYERIKQIVDIEEMCNYLSVQFYLGGNDYPKNNIKSFRERSEGESNSRFRAILFDLDHAFNTNNGITWFFDNSNYWTYDQLYGSQVIAKYGSRISGEIEFVTIIKNMLQNEEFKKQLVDQCCIVTGSVFEPTRAREVITEIINLLADNGHSASGSGNDVINKISTSRQNTTFSNIRNYFRLDAPVTVTLSSNIPEAGLLINGLNVPTKKFSGKLFAPIAVTAAAPAGYRFVGWQSNQTTAGVTLFDHGTDWNYYDQGSLDGEDWTAAGYSSSWSNGNAPLGYFVTDGSNGRGYKTFLNYGGDNNNKFPTYYFRKQITLTAAPKASESFTLNWIADDGFIIYVNGTEAGRYLMPSGNVSFNTYASTYANGNPDSGTMTIDASLFKRGVNTIAVELHNNAANSTDVMWDAALIYDKESAGDIASTETTFNIPSSTSSIKLTAIYEKMNDTDADAWDNHPVKINEVSADNDIYVSDLFKKSDWIELYNTTDAEIDVAGMYLSDHLEEPEKWQIPESDGTFSTIIPAHGHLVIWCDKDQSGTQLHAGFKLNNEDNSLVLLTAEDKSWADTLVYCRHDGYHTVGLYPDGTSQLYVMERPTIGKTNILTTLASSWEEPVIEYHEPDAIRNNEFEQELMLAYNGSSLALHGAEAARLDIYNTAGQLVLTTRIRQSAPVSVTTLSRGLYIARAKTDDDEAEVKFVIQ
jgi:hypothetical protein